MFQALFGFVCPCRGHSENYVHTTVPVLPLVCSLADGRVSELGLDA